MGHGLAQQKFGATLTLTGPEEFKMAAARVAAEARMNVDFDDEALSGILHARRAELDAAADPAWKSDPTKNNYANRLRSRSAFRPGPINGDCCHFATLPAKALSLPLVSRESPCCSAQRKVPHSLTASRD